MRDRTACALYITTLQFPNNPSLSNHAANPLTLNMPFYIKPFFRKPFKLFAIDADTGQPIDPNVRKKTRVTYYELENGSNGSKRLVAHKSPSNAPKAEATVPDIDKLVEELKKTSVAQVEQKVDDAAAWTADEDKKLKFLKEDGKTWAQITVEMGRSKSQLQARWKEINPAQGGKGDGGKKDNGGGGGGDQNQQGKDNKGGNQQGQGKKGKKKGGDNNNQNNNNKKDKKEKENQDQPKQQDKKDDKPASKQDKSKPASNKSNHSGRAHNEARFTMTDWLTLQEDDIFSFGELQCLSELIAKDMNQGWQRVAARFFDLTGRRVHPDDIREKFESMAMVA